MFRAHSFLALFVTLLGLPSLTRATVLETDPFDYALSQSIAGQNGGTGWGTNAWSNTDTNVVIAGTASSLSYPVGVPLSPSGSRIEVTATTTATAQATRNLGTTMSLSTSSNTFYSSALFRRSAVTGEIAGVNFFSGVNIRWFYGITTDGKFRIAVDPGSSTQRADSSSTAAVDTTYLLVAKIRTNTAPTSGNDEVFLKIFAEGDTVGAEPATDAGWDLATNGNSGVTLSGVRLDFTNGAGQTNQFDEFRVGTTWADVTGVVPEPGSLSVIVVAGLFLARRRAR